MYLTDYKGKGDSSKGYTMATMTSKGKGSYKGKGTDYKGKGTDYKGKGAVIPEPAKPAYKPFCRDAEFYTVQVGIGSSLKKAPYTFTLLGHHTLTRIDFPHTHTHTHSNGPHP